MSTAYCHEENTRLSQRACHILTGHYPSATKVTFEDDSDEDKDKDTDEITSVKAEDSESDKEEEEEEAASAAIDYFEESSRILTYNKCCESRENRIELIRETQQFRLGEEYGAGDCCDNTDCFRDFTKDYFEQTNVGRLCPDCCLKCSEEKVAHKGKRTRIE